MSIQIRHAKPVLTHLTDNHFTNLLFKTLAI